MQGELFHAPSAATADTPRPTNALTRPLGALLDEVLNDWQPLLSSWRASPRAAQLIDWVDSRIQAGATVFPSDVFRALKLTPQASARVVILGQDPYHAPEQAEGLAFSVPRGHPPPPSLRNIFKELQRSHPSMPPPTSGHLGAWAHAGVLLLNTILTVEQSSPGSHAKQGWESLTDQIISQLADAPPKVFMLWGAHAQAKSELITPPARGKAHLILKSNHPSPLSALRGPSPFIGCGHFKAAAEFLTGHYGDWTWPNL